jgi:hypothetical protein
MNITLRLLSTIAIFGLSLFATTGVAQLDTGIVATGIAEEAQKSVANNVPATDATKTPDKAVIT